MFYIIETESQLANLQISEECFIELVANSDETHPALNTPSVIYYNNFDKGYIFVINHSEGFSIPLQSVEKFLQQHKKVHLLNKKRHSYYIDLPNSVDLLFQVIGAGKELVCDTPLHREFGYKHKYLPNINYIIPVCKHYERCECLYEATKPLINNNSEQIWEASYVEVYKWVEEQGLAIDDKVFDKHYELTWKPNSVKNGKIYTSYNLYNITARPTNAFNGLNFLALQKDKARAAFVPSNDFFVDFDFDGYHLRLIANLLNVQLPADRSIHLFLGEHYFGKDVLTEEEYQESKKITFRQLYSGIEDEVADIELFKHVDEFIKRMWTDYTNNGYVILPNGRKLVQENANPQKLFNYYIQCLETVNNVKKLAKLKTYLSDKQSKVVLVVYDSILVDFSKQDGMTTYHGIKSILEEDNYMVKVKTGDNYDL